MPGKSVEHVFESVKNIGNLQDEYVKKINFFCRSLLVIVLKSP